MKALTALCTDERPISNGLHNNCKNSVTVCIPCICKKHLFVLLETLVFYFRCNKHVIVKLLRAAVLLL